MPDTGIMKTDSEVTTLNADQKIPYSREYAMVWDHTSDNPNGDMRNMNKPRRDDVTGLLEIRDARIKRYIRDEWIATGHKVLVQARHDEAGNTLSCENSIKPMKEEIKKEMGIVPKPATDTSLPANRKRTSGKNKDDDGKTKAIPGLREKLLQRLMDTYIDVRLFGVVVTDASKELGSTCALLGPLHVNWSKSVNPTEANAVKGTSCFSSGEEMGGGNISGQWVVPYSLFKSSAVFHAKTARRQSINVTEEDLNAFRTAFIEGLTNYKSTSKNPMPRLLVEVIYKGDTVDGELDELIDANYECGDEELRHISQVTFDLAKLCGYCIDKAGDEEILKDNIKAVNLYVHRGVNYINFSNKFKVVTF